MIQTKGCIYIRDESFNITHLITHMKNQTVALDEPLPSFGDLSGSWFGSGSSWLKSLLVTLTTLLAVLFIICLFYKIVFFCITRPVAKLMIAKHLKEIDCIYNIE